MKLKDEKTLVRTLLILSIMISLISLSLSIYSIYCNGCIKKDTPITKKVEEELKKKDLEETIIISPKEQDEKRYIQTQDNNIIGKNIKDIEAIKNLYGEDVTVEVREEDGWGYIHENEVHLAQFYFNKDTKKIELCIEHTLYLKDQDSTVYNLKVLNPGEIHPWIFKRLDYGLDWQEIEEEDSMGNLILTTDQTWHNCTVLSIYREWSGGEEGFFIYMKEPSSLIKYAIDIYSLGIDFVG